MKTSTICKSLSICIIADNTDIVFVVVEMVKAMQCETYRYFLRVADAVHEFDKHYNKPLPDIIVAELDYALTHSIFLKSNLKDVPILIIASPKSWMAFPNKENYKNWKEVVEITFSQNKLGKAIKAIIEGQDLLRKNELQMAPDIGSINILHDLNNHLENGKHLMRNLVSQRLGWSLIDFDKKMRRPLRSGTNNSSMFTKREMEMILTVFELELIPALISRGAQWEEEIGGDIIFNL